MGVQKGNMHFEMFGNNEIIVDGIKAVTDYSDCLIKINIGKGFLMIWGEKLEITSLSVYGLSITGIISKIEFDV